MWRGPGVALIAERLAADGWDLTLCARSPDLLDAQATQLGENIWRA
ncbi:hypothetical protein [Nocardia violaceofusca]|nr:hypothetical protein [Nocardia violaceofusca]